MVRVGMEMFLPNWEPPRLKAEREERERREAAARLRRLKAIEMDAGVHGYTRGRALYWSKLAEWKAQWRPPMNTAQRMLGLRGGDPPLTTSQSILGNAGWSAIAHGRRGPPRLGDVVEAAAIVEARRKLPPRPVYMTQETPDTVLVHGVLSECPKDSVGQLMQRTVPYVAFGKLENFSLPANLPTKNPQEHHVQSYVKTVLSRMTKACPRGRSKQRNASIRAFFAPLAGLRIACWCDPFHDNGRSTDRCYVRALAMVFAACITLGLESVSDVPDPDTEWPVLPDRVSFEQNDESWFPRTFFMVEHAWKPGYVDVQWTRAWCRVAEYALACPGFGTMLRETSQVPGSAVNATSAVSIQERWVLEQNGCPWSSLCSWCGAPVARKGGDVTRRRVDTIACGCFGADRNVLSEFMCCVRSSIYLCPHFPVAGINKAAHCVYTHPERACRWCSHPLLNRTRSDPTSRRCRRAKQRHGRVRRPTQKASFPPLTMVWMHGQ